MRTGRGIRSGTAAAVLAVAAALLAAPTAGADDAHARPGVRLNASALARLSARYQNRIDGTPGQVASQQGPSVAPTLPTGPAGSGVGATPARSSGTVSDTPSGTPGFQQTGQWETARGFGETAALGGTGDWLGIFSGGTVARYDAAGRQVWNRSATSLYTDWQVTPVHSFQPWPYLPNLYEGYDPYSMSTTGRQPYATGDFNGDGTADVAVAYAVADAPFRPFTSPGSTLDYGTFVTVLDGRTGRTDWSRLVPGYVGNMLVQDGRLIVADATGPQWSVDPVAEQGDSRSNLTAYRFTRSPAERRQARRDSRLDVLHPRAVGQLGRPDRAGRRTDRRLLVRHPDGARQPAPGGRPGAGARRRRRARSGWTPRRPATRACSPRTRPANRVLVVEQRDPFDVVGWDLTSVDARSGERVVITSREGTIPEAFQVAPAAHGRPAGYAVAELGINADLTDGQSTVSGWDDRGRTLLVVHHRLHRRRRQRARPWR